MMKVSSITLLYLVSFFPLSGANILFFNQDCNLGAIGADDGCNDSRYNILRLLIDGGHTIDTLDNFLADDLAARLSSNDFLFIPDLEDVANCNPTNIAFLPAAKRNDITDYVNSGGRVITSGSAQNVSFLNNVFSLSLTAEANRSTGVSTLNMTDAAGTPFESCPSTLPNQSVTVLISSSMPSNKQCIYEDGTDASVAMFNVGSGAVVYLGYDFDDVGTGCTTTTTDWLSCGLDAAIAAVTPPASSPIPTLSQWALITLGLLLSIIGLINLRVANLTRQTILF